MYCPARLPLATIICLAGAALARGQIGDTPEEGPQVALPAARQMTPALPLSPAEELATFKLPDGFRAEVVAAEPLIHDPVAAAFDLEGNLWVVEMSNYNRGIVDALPVLAPNPGPTPTCKIVKLESSRHDGHFDRRIVWLDNLAQPKGILIVHDGVLIADQPNLWLARDLHHSGHCDDKQLLMPNFEAWSDPEESGSLLWGRDNIIRDIDYAYDFRYHNRAVTERIPVPIRGQFGLSEDDWGRIYSNRNSDQLHCDLFAPEYALRAGSHVTEAPWAYVRIASSQEVWPIHPTPAINRAYRKGVLGQQTGGLRDDGTLLEFTAACSPLVYRGSNFPSDFYGNVFVPEPAANLIKRDLLKEHQGQLTAVDAYSHREFLASTDARFRPVALLNAPDGSMVVVDLYRGILQEYHYITTYLRNQTLGRGLEKHDAGMGRIFRIVATDGPRETRQPAINKMDAHQLAALLTHGDSWWRDTAQQELVERGDLAAVPDLKELALHGPTPITRVAALWTLSGLHADDLELLGAALKDPASKVRQAAVRIHERWLAGPQAGAALQQLDRVIDDPEREVSIQLALTLGESHAPAAQEALYRLFLAAGDHPFMAKAIVCSSGGAEWPLLQRLATANRDGQPHRAAANLMEALVTSMAANGDAQQMQQLITLAASDQGLPQWARLAVIKGLEPLERPAFRRSVGNSHLLEAAAVAPLTRSSDASVRTAALRLSTGMAREEEARKRRIAQAQTLSPAEEVLYHEGSQTFQLCASCHQVNGGGLPHVAPSLVDSRWVAGYPEVLAHIVLNGKEGTPGFPGAMPPVGGTLSDRQVAGVLTYIRNSWGLRYGAVSEAIVHQVRTEIGTRQAAWNDAELRRLENEAGRVHARAAAAAAAASPTRTH